MVCGERDQGFILLDHRPLFAPLMGVAKRIEPRPAQAFELG